MRRQDVCIALLIVMLWGASFSVIKIGLSQVSPMMLGALRYLAVAFPAIFLFSKPQVPFRWWMGYGFAVGFGQFAFLFLAIRMGLPAGVASVTLQLQALFTTVFAAFLLGEPFSLRHLLSLLFALCGLSLLVSPIWMEIDSVSPWAYVLALCAAASWAISNIILRKLSLKIEKFDLMSFIVWTSLVPPFPFMAMAGLTGELSMWGGEILAIGGVGWFSVIYLAVGGTLLGNGLFSYLLTRYPAGKTSSLTLLVPVVGLCVAGWTLGETLAGLQWLGCFVVLIGLLINYLPLSRVYRAA